MPTIKELEFAIEQMKNIDVTEGNKEKIEEAATKNFTQLRNQRGHTNTNCFILGRRGSCVSTPSGNWISFEAMMATDATPIDQRIRCMVCNNQNRMGKYNKSGWGICYSCVPKYIPATSDVPASLKNLKSQLTRKKKDYSCLLYTSPSPRDRTRSRMPSSA